MKTCPHCSAHYDPRVDFCFADGFELQVELGPVTLPLYQEDPLDQPLPEIAPRVEYPADLLEPPDPGHFALDDIGEESTADVMEPVGRPEPLDDGTTAPIPFGYEPTDPGPPDDGHTAPFPFSPDPLPEAPVAPLGDDVTVPIPLDQAQPIEPAAQPAPTPAPKPAPKLATPLQPKPASSPPAPPIGSPAPAPRTPAPAPEPDYDDDPERKEASRTGVFLAVAALIGAVVVAGVIVVATQGPDDPVVTDVAPQPTVEDAPADVEPTPRPTPEPVVQDTPEPPPADDPAVEDPVEEPPAADPVDDPVVDAELPEDPAADPVDAPANVQVRIQTNPPGALVSVDGKVVGNSPTTQTIALGPHKVRAELAGHKTMEILASVTQDTEVVEVRLPAVERTRSVQLFVPPGHYKVQVAGQSIDTLPATIELPIGTHTFVVYADDGSSFEVRKRVSDAQGQNLLLLQD